MYKIIFHSLPREFEIYLYLNFRTLESDEMSNYKLNKLFYSVNFNFSKMKASKRPWHYFHCRSTYMWCVMRSWCRRSGVVLLPHVLRRPSSLLQSATRKERSSTYISAAMVSLRIVVDRSSSSKDLVFSIARYARIFNCALQRRSSDFFPLSPHSKLYMATLYW